MLPRPFAQLKLWLFVAGMAALSQHALAATPVPTVNSANKVQRQFKHGAWFIAETRNFQVCSLVDETTAVTLAMAAEALRDDLLTKWLAENARLDWALPCQIVLHANRQGYTASVGRGSESTVGASQVKIDAGQVASRRIDLLCDGSKRADSALPHELTHVVLQDRFREGQMPRWAEEGLAVLADDQAKRQRHHRAVQSAIAQRDRLDLASLLTLQGYPSGRWDLFYGHSASIAEFLLVRGKPDVFLTFVEQSMLHGYDWALFEHYGIASVAELERLWRQQLVTDAAGSAI